MSKAGLEIIIHAFLVGLLRYLFQQISFGWSHCRKTLTPIEDVMTPVLASLHWSTVNCSFPRSGLFLYAVPTPPTLLKSSCRHFYTDKLLMKFFYPVFYCCDVLYLNFFISICESCYMNQFHFYGFNLLIWFFYHNCCLFFFTFFNPPFNSPSHPVKSRILMWTYQCQRMPWTEIQRTYNKIQIVPVTHPWVYLEGQIRQEETAEKDRWTEWH